MLNSGIDEMSGRLTRASGITIFVQCKHEGALKVSFFGSFYGSYNIVALEEDYRWAIIVGSIRNIFGFCPAPLKFQKIKGTNT